MSNAATFRVVARSLTDDSTRVIASGKSEKDAEAIVMMAVMRRGVTDECFYAEPQPEAPAALAVECSYSFEGCLQPKTPHVPGAPLVSHGACPSCVAKVRAENQARRVTR